ncbi:MAG: aldo/keto reductase, partial [Chloroflexota bacterium]|nr:aldo/keto reductase [Chloroflexota bacterium]
LYGAGGSERLIAQAFRERPDLAGDVLVTTKVGHLPGHDGTYDMAMRCVEGSMERLGVERFPLLYIHDPMDMPMGLVMGERGTLGALRAMQKRGLVDYVGVAANDPETNATYIETGEFDAAVVPEAWSLINRLAEERILPAAERHGTGLVIATPLELGLLAVGARETNTFPRRRFSPEVLAHVRQLETACEHHGVSLAAAALQYVVQHPTVAAVIAGARNPQEARANAAAMQEPIPAAFWDEVRPTLRHWEAGEHRLPPED